MTRLSQSTRGFTQQAESNGDVSIRPVPGVLPSTTAALPILVIRNGTASPVTVAYVLEQIYSALRNGINIVDAYLKGAIAADNVSLGRISLARVKQEHCTCSDEDTKSKNSHVCMCCAQRRVCATLTATADARLLCLSCLTKEERDAPRPPAIPPPNTSRPLMVRSTFRLRLTYMIQSAVASEPNINRDLFRAQLFRSIIDLDEGSWIDDYHGERNDNDARYEEGRWPLAKGSGDQASALLPHFAQLSIDAVRSVILVDGRPVYHHEDNFATTTFAINLVKYTYPPCILSALRALALYTLATKDADMVSPDPFPTELNHWMDRVHHISLLVPRSLKSRLHPASELSEKDMDIYQESCRTSLLRRGQESPYPGHKGTLYTADDKVSDAEIKRGGRGPLQDSMYSEAKKAASRIKQNPTPWQPWTKEQIATMLRIIGEIQRDPEANPYGIEIPTGGGGAPWPFTLEHMFEDDDLWDWWFHEIEDRYWRMFWFCNCEYDIDESPMTILLLIVIQWFKNGGKYDWLRCEMTVWVGHPFRFVLARAGEPGLPMKTGFTTTAPTSFKDYNAKECTIAVQPHVVNMLWWQFPVSTHPQLFLLLTGLLEQTVHYDAFRGDASSAPQYPEFSAVHRRRHRTDVSRPEELDVDLEEWALRQLEEDQRDEESGDDAQPEEVGEAADVGGLRSGLRDCRKRLRESGLDYRTDGFIQSQLYALHLAMADVDAVKFWDIIDMIDYHCTVKQAAKTSTSADQPQQIQSTHPASKKRGEWNLTNINNTCYIDSSVGILNHLPQIRDLMSNDANIIAKSEEKSGRSAGEYLPKHYSMSAPPDVRLQYAAEYMRNAEKLFKKIADVGRLVSSPAGPVDRQHSVALFNLVHAINPKEFHNKSVGSVPNTVQNDSLTLFHYLLEVVNAVTDDSSPSDRGRLARLEEREDKNFIDNKLEHYTQAMSEHWDAYSGKGKVSAITKFFAHQTVMERQCVVPGCYRIVRLFRHATSFPMALPPKGAPVDEFALLSMLEHTLIDDTADGTYETMLHCGFLPSLHTAPLCQYRKITILPKILMFSFNRQQQAAEGGADEELNKSQIDITEYLNMSRYSNDVELPSDRDTKQHATVSDKQPCIYRLTSINMYIPTIKHYVAYIVVDGEWLVFDDMYPRDRAAAEHPQVAINKGWLPCYVIYEQKDKTELPVDHAGQVTTGHLLSAKSGSARVPKPKVHDLYTPLTPEPVDDEMEDAGFQAGGDDTGHPNNQIANLLESGDRQILALIEKQMGAIVEERVSAIVKEQMGAIIEERVDAIVEQRVDALTWKHNDNLALNVDKIIKKVANRLNVGGNEVHQAMKEHRDGLFKEMTEQRDVLSQSMKEQRDELLHAMTELEDEKNKWWSEGSKGERLAVELHDRRQEDASQQIRKAALEERTLQQQDFDAKAGLMQKDFDDKAGLMQKDFDDKAREMQADFKEKAKQAQVAADSHTTHMVEKMAKEIELVTQRARENDDTEHARRMKEAAEGYSRHAKQQAKIKLEALAAEDAVQEAAQKVASETRRVARERQDEEQRAALKAQKRTREAEDKAQLAMLQAQQAARDAQRKALEQELAE
jgi:ubiquitin C-terminal hydrolase